MTLLAHLVATSQRVAATSARLAKVRELAGFLKTLPPGEVDTAVHYLSGETPQGRLGIGYSTLEPAGLAPAVADPSLSIGDVDATFALLPGIKGAGAAARRTELLRALWSRATPAEQIGRASCRERVYLAG